MTHTDGGHIYLQVNACLCLFPFSVELLMWPAARVQFACRGAFVCVCVVLFFFFKRNRRPVCVHVYSSAPLGILNLTAGPFKCLT